jgi:hypothetical protein
MAYKVQGRICGIDECKIKNETIYVCFHYGQIYHIYVDLWMLSSNNVCLSYLCENLFTYMDLWIIVVWVFNVSCLSTTHSVLFLSVSLLNQTRHGADPFYFIPQPNKKWSGFVLTFKRGAEPFHSHNLEHSHFVISDS